MNEYLKNKNIALIGPSNTLENKKIGDEIDKFDIVIRINSYQNLNSNDYGKKVNIIYHSFYKYIPLATSDTKFIISSYPIYSKNKRGNFIPKNKNRLLFNKSNNKFNKSIEHLRYDYEKYLECFNLGNIKKTRPSSGITTIYDILSRIDLFKTITIYGINFGLSNINSHYKVDKNAPHNLNEDLFRFLQIYNKLNKNFQNKIIIKDQLLKNYIENHLKFS
jgi:hypothetical protein